MHADRKTVELLMMRQLRMADATTRTNVLQYMLAIMPEDVLDAAFRYADAVIRGGLNDDE